MADGKINKTLTGYVGYSTDPVGTVGNPKMHSLWDKAVGTDSGNLLNFIVGKEGSGRYGDLRSGNKSVDPMTLAVEAAKSEREVYNSVQNLSNARTHGYIKNIDTGEFKRFQFNPENFEYDRAVNYVDYIAPQMAYPHTMFSGGVAREFELELFMQDRLIEPCGIIKDYMCFIGQFLTPEENVIDWQKPPEMLFAYGYFIRKCVLTHFNIANEMMDESGTPVQSRFTLGLRQIGVV